MLPFVTREQHLDILDQHDVFVFPSLSEGFGLALAEAMASGMPSVTTFTGLAHDWLEHGQNALLVPMRAPTALAREVRRPLEDVELRRTIGANGQRTARQWTWGAFGRSTATLYAQYLARLRGAAVPVLTGEPRGRTGAAFREAGVRVVARHLGCTREERCET